MTSNEILERRNARNNRALALFVTILIHGLVLGALFLNREKSPTQDKQEVAGLDSRAELQKP